MTTRSHMLCAAACGALLTCGCNAGEPKQAKSQPVPPPVVPVQEMGGAAVSRDAVIVTVNGKSLTRGMAIDRVRDQAMRQGIPAQLVDTYMNQDADAMLRQASDQFVDQTLMEAEISRRAEPVSDAEIEAAITRLTAGLPPKMSLTNALEAQGMTMAEFREQVVMSQRARKLFDAESPASNVVTDAEVSSFYKENEKRFTTEESAEARHILIACPAEASPETRASAKLSAETVRTQLVAGADFAQLASATSSCPSKAKGGSLGSFRRGQMVPAFEAAAFGQEIGAIGPVVETQFGYHVVQVTKRQPAGVTPLAEVSDKIRERLSVQARDKRFDAYLKTLRAGATIVYADTSAKDAGKQTPKP